MKEHPILFSGLMVRAILANEKTQTRRVIKRPRRLTDKEFDDACEWMRDHNAVAVARRGPADGLGVVLKSPYGLPGDQLWVRESHAILNAHGQHRADDVRWGPWAGLDFRVSPDRTQVAYYQYAFDRCGPPRWRPSIHMPRWASRIDLRITGVKAQRLHDITDADAVAEGVMSISDDAFWCRHFPAFFREVQTWAAAAAGKSATVSEVERMPVPEPPSPRERFRALWSDINGAESWAANPWVWVVEFYRRDGQ